MKVRESVTVVSMEIEWKSLDYLLGQWEDDLNHNKMQLKFFPYCKRRKDVAI